MERDVRSLRSEVLELKKTVELQTKEIKRLHEKWEIHNERSRKA